MKELWKEISGYSGYEISNKGRVRSYRDRYAFNKDVRLKTPIIMTQQTHRLGYMYVMLMGDDGKQHKCYIHHLIADAFIPNRENKPEVNHINGIKSDNRLSNLEWCTRAENMCHARDTGLWNQEESLKKARQAWQRKIYWREGRKRLKAINIHTGEERVYLSRKTAAEDLNIPDSYISNIIAGRSRQTRGWTFEDYPLVLEERGRSNGLYQPF